VQIVIGIVAGIAAGLALAFVAVQIFGATSVGKTRRIRRQLIEDAEREADAVRREAQIEAREQAVKLRAEIDSELADRRESVLKIEERVLAKEEEIEGKLVESRARTRARRPRTPPPAPGRAEAMKSRSRAVGAGRRHDAPGGEDAPARAWEELVKHDLGRRVRMLEESASRVEAARPQLVADALRRVAASHAAETTVTVIALPSDDMKGRIICGEGATSAPSSTSPASTSSSTTRRTRWFSRRSTGYAEIARLTRRS
jgi:ribonuclease Y